MDKKTIKYFWNKKIGWLGWQYYTRVATLIRATIVRRKPVINVIFIITELAMWKTELLYLKMRLHPRFNPHICVLPSTEDEKAKETVIAYLNQKGYPYSAIGKDESVQKDFKADIIFYQKPYLWVYEKAHSFLKNKKALLCYAPYCFHDVLMDFICNQPFHNYAWLCFFENDICSKEAAMLMDNKGRNNVVTGIPMSDAFLLPQIAYKDRWKVQTVKKKRIIWAPHFSLPSQEQDPHNLSYSTFLENADLMLAMAEKYRDSIQILFKPHPLLFSRVSQRWGEHGAMAYWKQWEEMENGQVETGSYTDFFMTSDAMIHDCGSFTIEYLYTGNPVMYLTHDSRKHMENLSSFARQAFRLHYIGETHEDIEHFIQRVLQGVDEKKAERAQFYRDALLPPNGKSACDNIIQTILCGKA